MRYFPFTLINLVLCFQISCVYRHKQHLSISNQTKPFVQPQITVFDSYIQIKTFVSPLGQKEIEALSVLLAS